MIGFLGDRGLHGGFLKDGSWVWTRLDGEVPKARSPVAFGLKVLMNSKDDFEISFYLLNWKNTNV